jgi:hypothetical protein
MPCPNCQADLSNLEIYDNLYQEFICTGCGELLFLDFEDYFIEETGAAWEEWNWILVNQREI